jgi:Swiss Army Knife protein, DSP-PTPase phosphatase domain
MNQPPLPNSYWVLPGRLLAGEHPFGEDPVDAHNRLARLREAGIDSFIDLTETGERPNYRRILPRQSEYLRFPIRDCEVPRDAAEMQELQARIRGALAAGRTIYLHCRAGIGRTGVAVGCFLADGGLDGKAALKELNRLWRQSARSQSWPTVPQTPEQADYIMRWAQLQKALK